MDTQPRSQRQIVRIYHYFALLLSYTWTSPLSLSTPKWSASAKHYWSRHEACLCQKFCVFFLILIMLTVKVFVMGKGQSIKTRCLWKSLLKELGDLIWQDEERRRLEKGPGVLTQGFHSFLTIRYHRVLSVYVTNGIWYFLYIYLTENHYDFHIAHTMGAAIVQPSATFWMASGSFLWWPLITFAH